MKAIDDEEGRGEEKGSADKPADKESCCCLQQVVGQVMQQSGDLAERQKLLCIPKEANFHAQLDRKTRREKNPSFHSRHLAV